MKSLEILSWFIDALGGFSDGRILVEKKELEAIKQDLEVLEILRKYLYLEEQSYDYDWEDGNTWMDYLSVKDIEDIDSHWKDDCKKLKQWLEENGNESQ